MAEMGRVTPGFHNGDEMRMWRVPIAVFHVAKSEELFVQAIYEEDGVLCIDVREKRDDDN